MKDFAVEAQEVMAAEIKKNMLKTFHSEVDSVKRIILENYNKKLIEECDSDSRVNPKNFRSNFEARLHSFDYVKDSGDTVTFVVPDMENFNMEYELELIRSVLDGVSGVYVELDAVEFMNIFKSTPDNLVPVTGTDIYLVKLNSDITSFESMFNTQFKRFSFSNTKPIDIFSPAEKYVGSKMDKWIDKAVGDATQTLKGDI